MNFNRKSLGRYIIQYGWLADTVFTKKKKKKEDFFLHVLNNF